MDEECEHGNWIEMCYVCHGGGTLDPCGCQADGYCPSETFPGVDGSNPSASLCKGETKIDGLE